MAKTLRDISKVCVICGTEYLACLHESRVCSNRCRLRLWRSMLPNPPVKMGSQEHREKQRQISLANGSIPPSKKGWKPSEQTRLKQSFAAKGKPKPWFIGRQLTQEHKRKIGEAAKRNESWRVLLTPEARTKMTMWALSNARRGANHWNWKGGKSDDSKIIRNTWQWKQWRGAVFARDNYECQWCGNNQNLNPHHRWPRKLRPDLMFDIENGITLCGSCHPAAERLFREYFAEVGGTQNCISPN